MDRLLSVKRYPEPEEKVRTVAYHQVGGGNAANVAHAAALLRRGNVQVQLGSKIGSDAVGQEMREELQTAGVDIEHGLFSVVPHTTTAFTTIIVALDLHTRTCMHTPGTCGEWTLDEIKAVQQCLDWSSVRHFHSDARQTEAALYLMQQAKQRGINVSLDVEKDRGSKALDEMVGLADIIFTNALQLEEFLGRLTTEWESTLGLAPLKPTVVHNKTPLPLSMARVFVRAIEPSTYFTRRYQQVGKQIVITKGSQGSIHVVCESVRVTDIEKSTGNENSHEVTIQRHHDSGDSDNGRYRLQQVIVERGRSMNRQTTAIYTLRAVGVLPNVSIVDTTGAGDAFLGGYLSASLDSLRFPDPMDRLRLAAWVAGHKIQGPGARTTLPTMEVFEKQLGVDNPAGVLRGRITPFENDHTTVPPWSHFEDNA